MSLFREMLQSNESIFRDSVNLDYDFQPKLIPYRESEQRRFAAAIKPLLQSNNGRNVFIHGPPGVGKTTACKHVIRELEEETDDVMCFYVNCWKENTTFKIFLKICGDMGYKFIQQKKTSELLQLIKQKANKKSVVFIFDEIDKLEEMDFLYTLLEDIYRKSIFLITNYRDTYSKFDERIRSRLGPEFIPFRSYNEHEISGILKQRRDYAFIPECWDEDAFKEIVEKCAETQDVRIGLYLLREAGNVAEEKSSRIINGSHVAEAMTKVEDFYIKEKEQLEDEMQVLLDLVKDNSGTKIGDLFAFYTKMGGEMSYKSFQRKINKLEEGKFVTTERVSGREGQTTLVHHASEKKLTDF